MAPSLPIFSKDITHKMKQAKRILIIEDELLVALDLKREACNLDYHVS